MPKRIPKNISSCLVLLLIWTGVQCVPQNTATQRANNVQCGNVIVNGHGTANLSCSGLTKEQAKVLQTTIPGMLEKLLTADAEEFATIRGELSEALAVNQGGNLRERALALADAMMLNLYERGWMAGRGAPDLPAYDKPFLHQPTPTDTAAYRQTWYRNMTNYWRFHFGEDVVQVRDDFAHLLLRDKDLDGFVASYKAETEGRAGTGVPPIIPVNPYEVEGVAKSLRTLANKLPAQTAPQ